MNCFECKEILTRPLINYLEYCTYCWHIINHNGRPYEPATNPKLKYFIEECHFCKQKEIGVWVENHVESK